MTSKSTSLSGLACPTLAVPIAVALVGAISTLAARHSRKATLEAQPSEVFVVE